MIAAEELDRIATVTHPNPHAILGPHVSGSAVVVRAFQPDALAARVVPDDPALPSRQMHRVHPAGIFEAVFPGNTSVFPYRLHLSLPQREAWLRDPYAFAPLLGDLDLHLAAEGRHRELHRHLGAHIREHDGATGTSFAVWAPNAERVSVVGDFNQWDGRLAAMRRLGQGIWEIFLPGVGEGALYKYEISTPGGTLQMKTDPYANAMELRPQTASKVVTRRYAFTDEEWIKARAEAPTRSRPLSIYEVHLGSFMRVPQKVMPGEPPPLPEHSLRWMTYRELADRLVDYVADLGFTHIELLPILEHPYDGSWGYQVSGYFAPTSRYGDPDDLRYFIDRCHALGLGVLLDWTPAHFPKDAFALGRFDGTPLYEHEDPRRGEHRQWETFIFDYGKNEVKNFLISSALYWMEEFHIDGLRVDAVASMLYLDYCSEQPGDWLPNKYGGRENLEAVAFLRELCDAVHEKFPGVILCAEESSTWPGVTRPTYLGGLGFDFKWNMGWMHDTLDYFALDPIHRTFHHRLITFGLMYAFSESYILPLSHDEVVHLKKSLLSKMHGDRWKMHASLRAMYGLMWAHPGKKLLFMGGEIGQWKEWNFTTELDWHLLQEPDHAGLKRLIGDLNRTYRSTPALWEMDDHPAGFTWIDPNDAIQSVASFVRFPRVAGNSEEPAPRRLAKGIFVIVCGNFTPVPRYGYRLGVPRRCRYLEVINTDAKDYGGSGMGNLGVVDVEDVPAHGFPQSIVLTLPPLATLWLVPEASEDPPEPVVVKENAPVEEDAPAAEDAAAEAAEDVPVEEDVPAEPTEGTMDRDRS